MRYAWMEQARRRMPSAHERGRASGCGRERMMEIAGRGWLVMDGR